MTAEDVFLLLPFVAIPAGFGIYLLRIPGWVPRVSGIVLILCGFAGTWWIVEWFDEGCYETWQPCEGRAISYAPAWAFLVIGAGVGGIIAAIVQWWKRGGSLGPRS